MSTLPKYKVWDGEMLHEVCEITKMAGGVKWYGPGVGEGWLFADPDFVWRDEPMPDCDLLLEVVTKVDF